MNGWGRKRLASLGELLKQLPKCQHEDRYGCDSFDTARGDHLCFNVATTRHRVTFGGRWPDEWQRRCDVHKTDASDDLPWASAYQFLKRLLETQ